MVNEHDNNDIDFDVEDEDHIDQDDLELTDEEATGAQKLKQLRQKLTRSEEEKRDILEESARTQADFLNARKRLENERTQDRIRYTKKHVEDLLPLCDSFEMARADKEVWEKTDENWRKGIEGIHTQLQKLIESYGVLVIDPLNEPFDPHKHEAIGIIPVDDKALHDKVVLVLQRGYEINAGDKTEVIRPARVTIGELTK